MLQSEFYERTGCSVSPEEFERIHDNYMAFDGNKDEFCRAWKRANPATVKEAKEAKEKAKRDRKLFKWSMLLDCYSKPFSVKALKILTRDDLKFLNGFGIFVSEWDYIGDVKYEIYRYFKG